MRTTFSLCLVIFVFLSCWSCPQSIEAGEVRGYVKDHFGQGIVGATVSGPQGFGTTSDGGFYSFNHPAGIYSFTVSATGYKDAVKHDIDVPSSGTVEIIFNLSPMSVKSTYPSLGELNKDIEIFIGGDAFDSDTRLSLMPDSGNLQNMVGQPYDTNDARLVALDDTTAYVVDPWGAVSPDNGILYIVDVADPTDPKELGTFSFPGYPRDLAVQSSYVYLAYGDEDTGQGGLYVINVGDAANPYEEGALPLGSLNVAYGIALDGSTAYVVDGMSGSGNLHAVDLSTPSAPSIDWSLDIPFTDRAVDIKLEGSMAYVANRYNGLKIVDIDPASANFKKVINTQGTTGIIATAVDVTGTKAFAGSYWEGLLIYDCSSPDNPVLVGQVDTTYDVKNIAVVDNVAYVAEGGGGLSVFDVGSSGDPVKLGTAYTRESVYDVIVVDQLAYLANGYDGLTVFNVSNPEPPLLVGSLSTSSAYEILLEGDTLYLAESGGFRSIDVSSSSLPTTNFLVENIGMIYGMARSNRAMFLAAHDYNNPEVDLQIIDLDNTTNVTTLDLGIPTSLSVAVNEDFIIAGYGDCNQYSTDGGSAGGLILVDRNDLTYNKRHVIDLRGCAYDVVIRNKLAYVSVMDKDNDGFDDNGLKIIDVDPSHEGTSFREEVGTLNTDGSPHGLAVEGGYAYLADTWKGLKIIDISTPSSPQQVGATGRLDSIVWGIEVNGDKAYVADSYAGVYVIDVFDKTNPVVIGWVDTPGQALDVTVDGGIAHVADSRAGLTIVPLPFEFTDGIKTVQADQINALLPSPNSTGHYIVRAFHDTVDIDATLPGAVTFTDKIDLLSSKAIIVAGGGPEASGDIWEETKAYANYAYDSLIYQGYKHEDIYYLTDEPNALARYGPLANYAHLAAATKTNLQYAITQWAKGDAETSALLLYLVDHGASEQFQIRGGADMQNVSASELDSWLDTLQESMKGKVVFVYDACKSGSFISKTSSVNTARNYVMSRLKSSISSFRGEYPEIPAENTSETVTALQSNTQGSGTGRACIPAIMLLLQSSIGDPDRVIITSSGSDERAYFLNPTHSFSYHFWSTLSGKTGNRVNLSEAFSEASTIMSYYQTAQLDANGNGTANENGDFSWLQKLEGTSYALRRQYSRDLTKPFIGIVSGKQILSGTSTATLTAENVYDVDGDTIIRVWAEIIRPDYNPQQSDLTVKDIPTVELTDPDHDKVYEGVSSDYGVDFDVSGPYIVNFYAQDAHGICSQPKTSLVIRE